MTVTKEFAVKIDTELSHCTTYIGKSIYRMILKSAIIKQKNFSEKHDPSRIDEITKYAKQD
jgi:hypothetical protein